MGPSFARTPVSTVYADDRRNRKYNLQQSTELLSSGVPQQLQHHFGNFRSEVLLAFHCRAHDPFSQDLISGFPTTGRASSQNHMGLIPLYFDKCVRHVATDVDETFFPALGTMPICQISRKKILGSKTWLPRGSKVEKVTPV